MIFHPHEAFWGLSFASDKVDGARSSPPSLQVPPAPQVLADRRPREQGASHLLHQAHQRPEQGGSLILHFGTFPDALLCSAFPARGGEAAASSPSIAHRSASRTPRSSGRSPIPVASRSNSRSRRKFSTEPSSSNPSSSNSSSSLPSAKRGQPAALLSRGVEVPQCEPTSPHS